MFLLLHFLLFVLLFFYLVLFLLNRACFQYLLPLFEPMSFACHNHAHGLVFLSNLVVLGTIVFLFLSNCDIISF